jgi:glycerol-3-phosphate acyltransferase PlsY
VIYLYALTAIFAAYLCGSIPTGYLIAKLYGVDVTKSGSGRIGGTNVLRTTGSGAAGLTVFGDVMKGLIPVFVLSIIASPLVTALAAPATVFGHNHSIFLKFRSGGVGAGTAIGSFGGINIWVGALAAMLAIVALVISRYASILSTTVALASLMLLIIFAALGIIPYIYILSGLLNTIIIINALRPNYARILAGTEPKVG